MTPTENHRIIDRMLQHLADGTTDLAAHSIEIPSGEFIDTARFQRERQKLFMEMPQVVAFSGEIAQPGSYMTTTILDVPVLLTRAADGKVRAFLNVCKHRGAPVAAGCGEARRLTCPFHGWSYDLEGSLAGRREAAAFTDMERDSNLIALPVAEMCGLIIVGAQTTVPQQKLENALSGIDAALAGFDFTDAKSVGRHRYEAAANWKLVAGLSHEAYHFASVHRSSLAPLMYDRAVVDTFGQHTRWAFAFRGIEKLAKIDAAQWPDAFPGAMNHTIFPATVIVVNSGDAEMIRVEPGRLTGESVVYYSGVARDKDNFEACREAFEFGGKLFEEEDLPAAEACQKGLSAGLPTVIVGRNEPVVQHWHQSWNKALEGEKY